MEVPQCPPASPIPMIPGKDRQWRFEKDVCTACLLASWLHSQGMPTTKGAPHTHWWHSGSVGVWALICCLSIRLFTKLNVVGSEHTAKEHSVPSSLSLLLSSWRLKGQKLENENFYFFSTFSSMQKRPAQGRMQKHTLQPSSPVEFLSVGPALYA